MDLSRLIQLEEESWADLLSRKLYATPLFHGFPWHTVLAGADVRRHVVPYYYTFRVFVKGRWVGRPLLDIYSEELAHHTRDYYEACVRQGRLRREARARHNVRRSHVKRALGAELPLFPTSTPSSKECVGEGGSALLELGDIVLHTVHRHEVPVRMGLSGVDPILLVAVRIASYGLLIIHKPVGLPTHASGRYFMNACTSMIEYVLAPKRLHAWIIQKDPLLQSLVSTCHLSVTECQEVFDFYNVRSSPDDSGAEEAQECVALDRLPRPCHRLDKVTSGILLLGVTQAATRRIGEALTKKTKQMEDIMLGRLSRKEPKPHQDGKEEEEQGEAENGDEVKASLGSSVLDVLNVGVRKHYLARVVGRFPERALEVRDKKGLLILSQNEQNTKGKDEEYKREETSSSHVKPNTTTTKTTTTSSSASSKQTGPVVLLTSPLVHYKYREEETLVSDSVPKGKRSREPVEQEAATLCQPLCVFGEKESLVHCIPLSGRLHQIRMHLSEWGHPITGDVSYGGDVSDALKSTPAGGHEKDTSSPSKENLAVDKNASEDGKDAGLFFSPEDLPKAFRSEFGATDELCWECDGKLPIGSLSDRNSSAIQLHAWQYEVDAELLGESKSEGSDETGKTDEMTGVEWKGSSLRIFRSSKDVAEESWRPVRREGRAIVFTAPPPAWALED